MILIAHFFSQRFQSAGMEFEQKGMKIPRIHEGIEGLSIFKHKMDQIFIVFAQLDQRLDSGEDFAELLGDFLFLASLANPLENTFSQFFTALSASGNASLSKKRCSCALLRKPVGADQS